MIFIPPKSSQLASSLALCIALSTGASQAMATVIEYGQLPADELGLQIPGQRLPTFGASRPKPANIVISSQEDIDRYIWEAGQYLKAGKFEGVIVICQQILKNSRNHQKALALLAAAHKALGAEDKFSKITKRLNKLAPNSSSLYLSLANAYRALNAFEKVEATYKEGLSKARPKTELRMGLASFYLEKGQLNKASHQYLTVLNEKDLATKHFLNASFSLCRIDLNNKAYDKVIKRATILTNRYPPIPQGYQFLANAYLGKGENKQAIKSYEKLMKTNPASPVSYQELALLYIDKLDDDKIALRYAKDASSKFPKDAKSQDVHGWIYYKNERYSEALEKFERATHLAKNNPFYFYHLGLTHEQLGNKTRAKDAFEQALSLTKQKHLEAFAKELKQRIAQ